MAAARMLFGNDDALGKLVYSGRRNVGMMQVVGIAGDLRMLGIMKQPGPQAYGALTGGPGFPQHVMVRTAVKPAALAPAIRKVVQSLDSQIPPSKIATDDDAFAEQVATPRFYMTLLNACAGVGLILAAIAVYGVIAFGVSRRKHEFGVRLALGAEPGDLVRLVLGAGARVIAVGAIIGLAGALAATRLLSALLFEVKPRDPLTLGSPASCSSGSRCWPAGSPRGA